jgi:hypothetical protein
MNFLRYIPPPENKGNTPYQREDSGHAVFKKWPEPGPPSRPNPREMRVLIGEDLSAGKIYIEKKISYFINKEKKDSSYG